MSKKPSFWNRLPSKMPVIAAGVLLGVSLFVFLFLTIVPNLMVQYEDAHRLDHIDDEFQAIDYVVRQALMGEVNFMCGDEIILVNAAPFMGRPHMSVYTKNARFQGFLDEYNWSKIELRETY